MKTHGWIICLLIACVACTATAAEYATFGSFYTPVVSLGVGDWLLIAGSVALAVGAVFLTGGTGGPVVVAIGTWIGEMAGLYGAAATSYGLALLGGGALTAGGLGMIGGAVILTGALTFGTEVTTAYAINKADAHYEAQKFAEESKKMLTLPPPRVEVGSDAYKLALRRLKDLDLTKPLADAGNQVVMGAALKITDGQLGGTMNADEACQLYTLHALLHFQRNEYPEARVAASNAIMSARALDRRRTLPAFIHAVSALYDEKPDLSVILPNYLRYSILAEPGNKLIPAMCGIFLDRAMYHYNSGVWTCGHIGLLTDILCEPSINEQSGVCLAILTTRILIQIKREQQSIYANVRTTSRALRDDPEAEEYLQARLQSYGSLVSFMRSRMIGEDP
jgi:hypothetical protein